MSDTGRFIEMDSRICGIDRKIGDVRVFVTDTLTEGEGEYRGIRHCTRKCV